MATPANVVHDAVDVLTAEDSIHVPTELQEIAEVDVEDAPEPDPQPIPVVPAAPVAVTVTPVYDGAATFAAGLADDSVVVDTAGGLVHVAAAVVTPLGPAAGQVRAVAELGGAIVAGTEGLFVIADGGLLASPLSDLVADGGPASIVVAGEALWLADAGGLHRWSGGTLQSVAPDGLPVADAKLAYGAHAGGVPGVWVASGAAVYALVPDGAGLAAIVLSDALPADAMACDGAGRLWIASAGDLHRRDADGEWTWLRFPAPVLSLSASPDAPELWVRTATTLYVHVEGAFHPVDGAPPASHVSSDGDGRALIATPSAVVRVWLGEVPEPEPVTWLSDIEPLYTHRCSECHAPGGLAPTKLQSRELWIANYEKIIYMLTEGFMPLYGPPLDPSEIALITAWAAGGFAE